MAGEFCQEVIQDRRFAFDFDQDAARLVSDEAA